VLALAFLAVIPQGSASSFAPALAPELLLLLLPLSFAFALAPEIGPGFSPDDIHTSNRRGFSPWDILCLRSTNPSESIP
jgi:hypothetical protein